MAINFTRKSLELNTSLQTSLPLIPQVSLLTKWIVDEDANDLLKCPNCNEFYSAEVWCFNCWYNWEKENQVWNTAFVSDFEVDNRTAEYKFNHGLFSTSEIEIFDGEIKEVKFSYLWENYKVLISPSIHWFRISIYKLKWKEYSYEYVPRFHFDQIRNFIYVLLKDYKDKQN